MNNKYDKFLQNLIDHHKTLSYTLHENIFAERIESFNKALGREKINILIVGEFSRGKSTFINALLGKPYLPANVNPTTATINIISFSETPGLTIEYSDGTTEMKKLPEAGINKFLDDFVSVKNKSADKIKLISLSLPEIERFRNIRIVDTPGVNDLDESRAEITIDYLSQADACILLLDSQQPLSNSEKIFIESQIFRKDIKKLFYVINKIDQISNTAQSIESQISRIENYVREKLVSELALPDEPKIYSVSSLEALKAKYKSYSSTWSDKFSFFENDLINFAASTGTHERLELHYARLLSIIDAGKDHLSRKIALLQMDHSEIEKSILESKREQDLVQKEIKLMMDQIEAIKIELRDKVKSRLTGTVSEIKQKTSEILEKANTVEDLLKVRQVFNEEVRRAIDAIVSEINERVLLLESQVVQRASIESESQTNRALSLRGTSIGDNSAILEAGTHFSKVLNQNDAIKTVAIAGGGGAIAAALIGGPVGIAIAAVGAILLNKKFQEERQQKVMSKIKSDVSNDLALAIGNFESGIGESSARIVSAEFEGAGQSIKAFLQDKMNQVNSRLEFQAGIDQSKISENKKQSEALQATVCKLEALKVICLKEFGEISGNE